MLISIGCVWAKYDIISHAEPPKSTDQRHKLAWNIDLEPGTRTETIGTLNFVYPEVYGGTPEIAGSV
jgi:hypothetical protein